MNIDLLPNELWVCIFSFFLEIEDLHNTSHVCKEWRRIIIQQDSLWQLLFCRKYSSKLSVCPRSSWRVLSLDTLYISFKCRSFPEKLASWALQNDCDTLFQSVLNGDGNGEVLLSSIFDPLLRLKAEWWDWESNPFPGFLLRRSSPERSANVVHLEEKTFSDDSLQWWKPVAENPLHCSPPKASKPETQIRAATYIPLALSEQNFLEEWQVGIPGLPETWLENVLVPVRLLFPRSFPFQPPECYAALERFYHPLVLPNLGLIHFEDDLRGVLTKPTFTVKDILILAQLILSNPGRAVENNLSVGVNVRAAAEMWMNDFSTFTQILRENNADLFAAQSA